MVTDEEWLKKLEEPPYTPKIEKKNKNMIKEIQIKITRTKSHWIADGIRDKKVKVKGKGYTRLAAVDDMLQGMDLIGNGRNKDINHDALRIA